MASEIKVDTIVNAGGDNDSGIDLATNDQVKIKLAGTEVAKITTSEVSFNENSADTDFRVESNNEANMFVVDAGNDRIGIGTNAPAHKLDVVESADAFGARITNNSDGSQGLQVRTSDNDGGQFILDLQSSTSATGTDYSSKVVVDKAGNLLVGTTSTNLSNTDNDEHIIMEQDGEFKMQGAAKILMTLNRNLNGGEILSIKQENNAVGGIDANSSSVDFNTSSDYRLKENVTTSWDATTRLKQLKPVRFSWKKEGKSEADTDGFLAHEVSSVVPQATKGTKDEVVTQKGIDDGIYPKDAKVGDAHMQSIDHSKLVPLLVKTIQELEARIATLESK